MKIIKKKEKEKKRVKNCDRGKKYKRIWVSFRTK